MAHLPQSTRRRLVLGLVAAATIAALLPGSSVALATAAAATTTRASDGGRAGFEQRQDVGSVPAIQWKTCEDDKRLQCATYAVPLDYGHPEAGASGWP